MISLTKSQGVPKKYQSIVKAVEGSTRSNRIVANSLFGSGLVNMSADDLETPNFFTVHENGISPSGVYRFYIKYTGDKPLIMAYQKDNADESILVSLPPNQFHAFYRGVDETDLVSSDSNNKIRIPMSMFYIGEQTTGTPSGSSEYVPEFSSPYYSALYINGSPQRYDLFDNMEEITMLDSPNGPMMELGFQKIRGGVVYPDPHDTHDRFNRVPIIGATLEDWLADFTYYDEDVGQEFFALRFSNFNLNNTPRMLIADVFNASTSQVDYINIPKDLADEETSLYYRVDEDDPSVIYVTQEYLRGLVEEESEALLISFYFVTPVESVSAFTNGASLSHKFKLPFTNVLPIGSDFRVLIHDTVKGTVVDAAQLSAAITGSVFDINYETGHLEIVNVIAGLLNENVHVYIANLYYAPPLQLDYTHDIGNTIAVYGTKGSVYEQTGVTSAAQLPQTLHLYTFSSGRSMDFTSFNNYESKLITIPQYRESDIRFLLSEESDLEDSRASDTGYQYFRLGHLEKSGTNYLFHANDTLTTPYDRILDLAKEISPIGDPFNITSFNGGGRIELSPDIPVSVPRTTRMTVCHIPYGTRSVQVYGYLTEIEALSGGIRRNFRAELILYDTNNNSETLIRTIVDNSTTLTYFEHVPSNYKEEPFAEITIPDTQDRKYLAVKVTMLNVPHDPDYDVTMNADFYVRMIDV